MSRFSRSRTQSWSTTSTNMSYCSASSQTKSRVRDFDTGFPEPFCGTGNTTLRHPEADTSPNACISGSDFDLQRVYQRSRRFTSRNKRAVNHGKLTQSQLDRYAVYSEMAAITESATRSERSSSQGSVTYSTAMKGSLGDGSRPVSSSTSEEDPFGGDHQRSGDDGTSVNQSPSSKSTRGGMFRKLRTHS